MSIQAYPSSLNPPASGGRSSVNLPHSAAAGFPLRLLFAIATVFNFPAFTLQLAIDMHTGQWTGSPILRVATIGSEILAIAVILSSRRITRFVLSCWPIFVLIATAFVSAVWSRNPAATIHGANTYMTSALLGLAIVGTMPQFQCVRFCIRIMVLGCILSIAWVLFFPTAGIHSATDLIQSVHAGLWRGVFSHKQGLGVFAGITTGVLLFYRTKIFKQPLYVASLVSSLACLFGTQSATGFVLAVATPAVLYLGYFVARSPMAARRSKSGKVRFGRDCYWCRL